MEGFTKLSRDLVTSSIWSEDDSTRIVFVTMLAMADSVGYVATTIPGLARMAHKTIQEVEAALAVFMAPDPYSRCKDGDGIRVIETEGGYLLTGHERHRNRRDPEVRRAQNRKAQARFRAKKKDSKQEPLTDDDISQSKPKAEGRRQKTEKEKQEKEKGSLPVKFDFKKFDSWSGTKSEILRVFPGNKTIQKLLARITTGKSPDEIKVIIRALFEICQTISKPEVQNPGGLLNKKLHDRFQIKEGVKL